MRRKKIEIGDLLMLGLKGCDTTIWCRVYETPWKGFWRAWHLMSLGRWAPLVTKGVSWYGPDPDSWSSVTNLGPVPLDGGE